MLQTILQTTLFIVLIVMCFNIIIFVHELGHFLAARWRGLQVDRFQIWFGKPIWKKTINGVDWGIGWLPFGGFVALPQMAPMEAIEGGAGDRPPLPPVSPLDKIIVAFAGPLFSMLLALACACVVWQVGKPKEIIPCQEIGMVVPGGPADKAGLKAGDRITQINGREVNGFAGPLNSIQTSIFLSKGNEIEFTVERPGESKPVVIRSGFIIPESRAWQRRGLRQVGIFPKSDHVVVTAVPPNSPAEKAGIKVGDKLVSINGREFSDSEPAVEFLGECKGAPAEVIVERKGKRISSTLTGIVPVEPADGKPRYGLKLSGVPAEDLTIIRPDPFTQVKDSLMVMWTTISNLVSRDSNIGIDHLSGPVGIAKHQFALLNAEFPWQRLLAFMVLFNVNLAVLNMLPLPVLDGGHITLSLLEWIARRPVRARVLEVVQTAFAVMLMALMLYVTTKDIGDPFGRGGEKVVFPK